MEAASQITKDAINAGLRRPVGADPVSQALAAVNAAHATLMRVAASTGADRTRLLAEVNAHADTVKQCVSADRLRSERAA